MAKVGIKKIKHWHDMIIDHIIAMGVGFNLNELSKKTGYTVPWLSVLLNNDIFQARLRKRREVGIALIDTDVKAKMGVVANKALDKLASLIPLTQDISQVNDVAETILSAMGYTGKQGVSSSVPNNPSVNNIYIGAGLPDNVVSRARKLIGNQEKDQLPVVIENSDANKLLSPPE